MAAVVVAATAAAVAAAPPITSSSSTISSTTAEHAHAQHATATRTFIDDLQRVKGVGHLGVVEELMAQHAALPHAGRDAAAGTGRSDFIYTRADGHSFTVQVAYRQANCLKLPKRGFKPDREPIRDWPRASRAASSAI